MCSKPFIIFVAITGFIPLYPSLSLLGSPELNVWLQMFLTITSQERMITSLLLLAMVFQMPCRRIFFYRMTNSGCCPPIPPKPFLQWNFSPHWSDKVKKSNICCSPLVCYVSHFIVEGYQVGQGFLLCKAILTTPLTCLSYVHLEIISSFVCS